jgi:hypothetical protein
MKTLCWPGTFVLEALVLAVVMVTGPIRAGEDPLHFLGVVHEVQLNWQPPLHSVVRVAFRKLGAKWVALPDPAHAESNYDVTRGLPESLSWNACFDGRTVGSFVTRLASGEPWLALLGVHEPAVAFSVPYVGNRSRQFSGWMNTPVYHPLVVNSAAGCSDPDGWKPAEVPAEALRRLIPFFRTATHGITSCDRPGKPVPYTFSDSEIHAFKSYSSVHGDRVVNLVVQPRPDAKPACEGSLESFRQWAPHMFFLPTSGDVVYLGDSLLVVDAGDYDGDGESEVMLMFERYDYDGFMLTSHHFADQATYGWIYH